MLGRLSILDEHPTFRGNAIGQNTRAAAAKLAGWQRGGVQRHGSRQRNTMFCKFVQMDLLVLSLEDIPYTAPLCRREHAWRGASLDLDRSSLCLSQRSFLVSFLVYSRMVAQRDIRS